VVVCFVDIDVIVDHQCLIFQESLNSDGQQLHQYQQNKQPPLT
jgi:hypothetical protein